MENTISQVAFEFTIEKMAQTQKRLFIIIIVLILALIGSNAAWIAYESQYEDIVQEVEQKADNGENHFIGGDLYSIPENNNEKESP